MAIVTANSNIMALKAQIIFNRNTDGLTKAMNRLTTGLKINTAKDDPAGLAISERLNLQIVGNNQVTENIQIGMNVINIAEGTLNSILKDINRIRDLSVQGANNFYTTDSTNAILKEMQCRLDNINQMALSCEFNGKNLLDGTLSSLLIQSGFGSDATLNTVDLSSALKNCQTDSSGLDIDLADSGLVITTVTADDFASYVTKLDDAIAKSSTYTSDLGAKYNKLDSLNETTGVLIDNQTEAKSSYMDADVAKESSNMIKFQILQQTSMAVLTQANTIPQIALSLLQ